MKKISLSLFLLTSLTFYAQVADMVHCTGDNYFDLTSQYSLLIGNLNPTETTVSYHLTSDDAINGTNAISNPSYFIISPTTYYEYKVSQTVYARIKHLEDITTNTFNVTVNMPMNVLPEKPYARCDGTTFTMLQVMGGQAPYNGQIWNQSNFYPIFDNYPPDAPSFISVFNMAPGTYDIIIYDAIGCSASFNGYIVEPAMPLSTPTTTVVNVKCKGSSDGAITVNATGGQAPLRYSIDNGESVPNNTFTNVTAGQHTIDVYDAKGCRTSTTATITEPTSLQNTAAITQPIDCTSNAIVTLAATGGTTPYTYSKDGAVYLPTNVFDNLIGGTHSMFVKDSNGCISQNVIIIAPSAPLIATIVKTDVSCNGANNGSITINTIGGQSPYTYTRNGGAPITSNQPTAVFSGLPPGSYTIIVTDAGGCANTRTVIIAEPSLLYAISAVKNQTITITATGGAGNYQYAISPDLNNFSSNNVFPELTAGSYAVITQDPNGCYITTNATVNPPAPTIKGLGKLIVEFIQGQTLADLKVTGQNIKWYIHQYLLTGKTSKTSETPLPLTTVLEEGATYYASQTINEIESTERLEVTVKSTTLETDNFVIKDFTFYPNPVKNIFTISNTSIIDEITLTSINGATLLTKQINSLNSEIDLSNFAKGVYFLKVKSEGTEKTVKLIKE